MGFILFRITNTFTHSGLLFYSLNSVFWLPEILNFNVVRCIHFFFYTSAFLVLIKRSSMKIFCYILFSRSIIILPCTFRSMICLELSFIDDIRWWSRFLFAIWIDNCPRKLHWKKSFLHWRAAAPLLYICYMCVGLFLGSPLCSIGVLSIAGSISHCFNYFHCIIRQHLIGQIFPPSSSRVPWLVLDFLISV